MRPAPKTVASRQQQEQPSAQLKNDDDDSDDSSSSSFSSLFGLGGGGGDSPARQPTSSTTTASTQPQPGVSARLDPADHVNPLTRKLPVPPPPSRGKNADDDHDTMRPTQPMTEKEKWKRASMLAKRMRADEEDEKDDNEAQDVVEHLPQPTPAGISTTSNKKKKNDGVVVDPPPPPRKQIEDDKQAASSSSSKAKDEFLFPHADDQRRLENYIYMCTLSIAMTGKIGGVLDLQTCNTISDIYTIEDDANVLFRRFRKFRRQLYESMVDTISKTGNPVLLAIVSRMNNCKLTVYSKPKYLIQTENVDNNDNDGGGGAEEGSGGGGGGGGVAYDVWTLREIATEDSVRSAALTPVSGTMSQPKAPPQEFMDKTGVMFQIDSEYVNVLKCLYTLLFFLDFLNSEIAVKVEAVLKTVPFLEGSTGKWSADIHATWDRLFARDLESRASLTGSAGGAGGGGGGKRKSAVATKDVAKQHPMYVFVEGIQKQLTMCCLAMQKIVGKRPFLVIMGDE